MPGTMTRLNRVRTSAGSLRLVSRSGSSVGPLNSRYVALVGADVSPHITGFGGFTSSLHGLLVEHVGQVSRPLQASPSGAAAGTSTGTSAGAPAGTPDLVVAVLPGPGAAGAAAELADQHDVPLLVIVQGETSPLSEDAATGGARLAAKLESRALKRADRWAVTGESARRRLLGLGVQQDRIDALPFWAEAVRSGPQVESERAAVRRSLGWPAGFLVVCPVGADTSGLVAVVAAAHQLAARGSDVQVVLVGRGPRLRALSASAAEGPNVMVAEVPDEGYAKALFAADLLVLTETADRPDGATAGRLAAAMAAGRPTIAALADGDQLAAELARAEGAVVTVAADRPEQLADAMDVLRSEPQALAVMASAARHYTRANLSPVMAAATLEQIAVRTLSRQAGSPWWGWNR